MSNLLTVNARFTTQTLTGVQRYAAEILHRLPKVTLASPSKPADAYSLLIEQHNLVVRTVQWGRYKLDGHPWEQVVLPRLVPTKGWLWSPGGSGPLVTNRQVVTIHDVAHLEHPEWYSWKFSTFYRWLLPRLLKRVSLVLTVSEFSKVRIVDIFGLSSEKVIVTPLGVDTRFSRSSGERVKNVISHYGIDSPYLISIASISERKNLRRLIEAWHQVGISGIRLVIVGAKGLPFAGKSYLPSDPSIMYLGYVPDEDLPVLYSGAVGAIYVSLYEGFGLPVLEAMACGTPVLASNVTSLPEVVGDAGLLVDPYDVEAIAHGICRLIGDSALREELKRKGLERAKQFTWERTADLTWQVLQEVMGEG